jgi:hypothetical protein
MRVKAKATALLSDDLRPTYVKRTAADEGTPRKEEEDGIQGPSRSFEVLAA